MIEKDTHADRLRDHAGGAGPIRLLVVDRQPDVRKGLEMRLGLEEDLEVVGEAADADGAIPLARALRPDVILMDVGMPGGIAITKALRTAVPHSAVVVLTLRDDPTPREQARAADEISSASNRRAERMLLAAIRGVAQANAMPRRLERALVSRKEERTDAISDRRGA